jgi:pyruvate formate lyase activating enzyme
VSILEQARAAALSVGLQYVYIGNIPGHEGENTFCPRCKRPLIERSGFMVRGLHLRGGKCPACGTPVPGIWA